MLFNSVAFAIFLPIVFILYWGLPNRFRWILLLAASYYFYMSWNAKYIVLILFTTAVSYIAARLIENSESKKIKKMILTVTAVLCLGVLFFFKYYNFAVESFANMLGIWAIQINPITVKLLLPVGISFYTFQTLSYVIDVYKGDVKAEKHFGYYATFISFFPQLVAGPIERTYNLLPQIKDEHKFDYDCATYGLKLMAWGYFKKIVIADTLSKYVSTVYDSPQGFTGFALVIATLFFTLQIYCDFSGYSDIAIGTAKLLGINLMTNFKSPYFSESIKEFWSRWHISLSTWFRDYIYIPLGGNRVGKLKHSINLIITFLASGLWHGANWTFVVWGAVHGVAQVIENTFGSKIKQNRKGALWWIKVICVFAFTAFAWIFFVSNTMGDAKYVITHCLIGLHKPKSYLKQGIQSLELSGNDVMFLVPSILILAVYDYLSLKKDVIREISSKKVLLRWAIYVIFIVWLVINIPLNNASEFIYFQF